MVLRERLFLFLSGIFLTSLILGNIVGITKFVKLEIPGIWTFVIPVGLLAYPITFLATDIICEVYGREKAQSVVWTGFFMNLFMLALMGLGHILPDASGISGAASTFEEVFNFMVGGVIASMIAYLIAQTCDVRLFHFWRRLTKGKHLWLRNCGSTFFSQIIDTVAILCILFYFVDDGLGPNVKTFSDLLVLMGHSYLFKFCFALIDTPFFYAGVYILEKYFHLKPAEE
ncbi:queuosine precursor transporter [bacterium]|nr:queuosine precursor transporter [bacterium]